MEKVPSQIVRNTCGSCVRFVQFSQCGRIRVHGVVRLKKIVLSAYVCEIAKV